MHLRATRVNASPAALESLIANLGTSTAAIRELPGCSGIAVMTDVPGGRAIVVGYWDSEGALTASEPDAKATRDRIAAEHGVEVVRVERYEVVTLERTKPLTVGTCVRVVSGQIPPNQVTARLREARETVLPVITGLRGFRSVIGAGDVETGRILLGSAWDTAADRDASHAALQPLRERLVRDTGEAELELEHYDIAYADLPAMVKSAG